MNFQKIKKNIILQFGRYSIYPSKYPIILSHFEKILFDQTVKDSINYLEFGMGGSTFRVIQKSKANIYTVESSSDWIYQMRRYLTIRFFEMAGRLTIYHVNIGQTGDWGYPIGEEYQIFFPSYSSDIFTKIDKRLVDTVFVDGRFRVACILKTILECYENERLIILIHDFQRESYHLVKKYLDEISSSESLFSYRIRKGIDLESVKSDYDVFKYCPE